MESLKSDDGSERDLDSFHWVQVGYSGLTSAHDAIEVWASTQWGERKLVFLADGKFEMDGELYKAAPVEGLGGFDILRWSKKPIVQERWLKFSPAEKETA